MSYKLLLSDEAYYDILDAIEFYRILASPKIENKFREQLKFGIDYISKNPLNLSVKYRNIRIYNLKNFPFQIHFLVMEDSIYVIGIFHGKSNPKSWIDRMNN